MIRIAVKILPKKEVLDTQGRAVLEVLHRETPSVRQCQVGKLIVLEFEDLEKDSALKQANAWAKDILSNPLIEDFELEVI